MLFDPSLFCPGQLFVSVGLTGLFSYKMDISIVLHFLNSGIPPIGGDTQDDLYMCICCMTCMCVKKHSINFSPCINHRMRSQACHGEVSLPLFHRFS